MRLPATLCLALVLFGCTSSSTLSIDVISDLAPGLEVDTIVVEHLSGIATAPHSVLSEQRRVLRASDDLEGGLRVATFEASGDTVHLLVHARDAAGMDVLARPLLVRIVSSNQAATVVLTRSCAGVTCPEPTGDPEAIACLAGRCERPECTRETPEACGPSSCSGDPECLPAGAPACVDAACRGGVCLVTLPSSECATAERCDLELGCVPDDVPPTPDAGVPDAGVPDASGIDSGVDAGDPMCAECEDGNPCTLVSCGAGGCTFENTPFGTPCPTNIECALGASCNGAGVCVIDAYDVGATCDDRNPCTEVDVCGAGGDCRGAPVPDATSCDDRVECIDSTTCVSGTCTGFATTSACGGGAATCEPMLPGCLLTSSAFFPLAAFVDAPDRERALGVSGEWAFAGAIAGDGTRGSVQTMRRVAGTWRIEAPLSASGLLPGDRFGASLAVSGSWLAVGATGDDTTGRGDAVYVFELSGGAWVQRARLTAPAGDVGVLVGRRVAIEGDLLVAGHDRPVVFENLAGTWTHVRTLPNTAPAGLMATADDLLGVGADRIAMGLPRDGLAGFSDSGTLVIANRHPTLGFEFGPRIAHPYGGTGSRFARFFDLDGPIIGVSTYQDGDGSAWVFEDDGSGGFTFTELVTATGVQQGYGFSITVAGTRITVGSKTPYFGFARLGAVHVFDRLAAGWSETYVLLPAAAERTPGVELGTFHASDGATVMARSVFGLHLFEVPPPP